jgi:hypothetical protein
VAGVDTFLNAYTERRCAAAKRAARAASFERGEALTEAGECRMYEELVAPVTIWTPRGSVEWARQAFSEGPSRLPSKRVSDAEA